MIKLCDIYVIIHIVVIHTNYVQLVSSATIIIIFQKLELERDNKYYPIAIRFENTNKKTTFKKMY